MIGRRVSKNGKATEKNADYSAKDIVAVALNIGNYTRMKMYRVGIADNEASAKQ